MITIVFLAVTLLTAAVMSGLILVRLATTREHREGRLPAHPTSGVAAVGRAITGLYVELPR